MILTAEGAAHKAWVQTYKLQGPPMDSFSAFQRGFNEGAAHALESYLKVKPHTPKVPTVDQVREIMKRRGWFRGSRWNPLG